MRRINNEQKFHSQYSQTFLALRRVRIDTSSIFTQTSVVSFKYNLSLSFTLCLFCNFETQFNKNDYTKEEYNFNLIHETQHLYDYKYIRTYHIRFGT